MDNESVVVLIPEEQQPLSPDQAELLPGDFDNLPIVVMAWLGRCRKVIMTGGEFRIFMDQTLRGFGPARFYVERY